MGFTPQAFGIALTLASLPLIFGAPFWGKRSDVIGRKPVFIIGVTGAAVGTLLVALVLQLGVSGIVTGFWLLVLFALARASYGAAASAIYPAATAYMVDVTDVQNRGRGLAIIGAANGMGSVLGPVLAGALAFFGPLVPMYVAAAIGIGGAVMAWFLLQEPARHADPRNKVAMKLSDRRLRPFLIMWFGFFLTFMALQIVLSFYLQDEYGITDPKDLRAAGEPHADQHGVHDRDRADRRAPGREGQAEDAAAPAGPVLRPRADHHRHWRRTWW